MDISKEIIEDQSNRLREASITCSNNCRYITFALLAVIWGLYCKVEPSMYSNLYVLLGMLIIYLIIDTLQYLIPTILHRSDLSKLRKGKFRVNVPKIYNEDSTNDAIRKTLIERINQISKITYDLFIFKIILLLTVSILIILFIINMGSEIQKFVK